MNYPYLNFSLKIKNNLDLKLRELANALKTFIQKIGCYSSLILLVGCANLSNKQTLTTDSESTLYNEIVYPKDIQSLQKSETQYDAQADFYQNILLAKIALGQKQYEQALQFYKKALDYQPETELIKEALVTSELLKDEKSSVNLAKKWLALDSKALSAWRLLTFYAVKSNNIEQAKTYIAHVLDLEKDNAELIKYFGQLTFGQMLEPAYELFTSIQAQYTDVPEIPLIISHIKIKQQLWADAEHITSELIQRKPNLKYAWVLKGIALESQAKVEKAIQLYKRADHQFRNTTEFKRSLGHLLYEHNQFSKARNEFLKILDIEPSDTDSQYMVAASYFSEDDFTQSRKFFEPLLKNKRHRNAVLFYLAEMARKEESLSLAIKLYKQVKRSRYFETSHIQVSQLLKVQGLRKEAFDYLKNLDISVEDSNIRYVRAMDAELLGQSDYAIKEFRSILKYEPKNYNAMNALGYTLADHDLNLEEALSLITSAHQNLPNNAAVIDSVGWVHYKLGNYLLAQKYLEQAYGLEESPDTAAHLAIVLIHLNKSNEAVKLIKLALKQHPTNSALIKTIKTYSIDLDCKDLGSEC